MRSAFESGDYLTARERGVLALLTEGLKAKEIAEKLCISITTVRSHVQHIYEKFDVNSRVELLKQTGHHHD